MEQESGAPKDRATELYSLIKGPLTASLESLSESSKAFPGEMDFFFYENFPAFRDPVKSIRTTSEHLLSKIGGSYAIRRSPSKFPGDPDDAPDWFVDLQDGIIERVDAAMDDVNKVKMCESGLKTDLEGDFQMVYGKKAKREMRRAGQGGGSGDVSGGNYGKSGVKVVSRDKRTTRAKSYVPFHIANIVKPQHKFGWVIDNSNKPFEHRGLKKTEDGSRYIHLLQEELDKLAFVDDQMVSHEPIQPCPWDSTPFMFVETVKDLSKLAEKLNIAKEIAVDLEHNQYRSFQGLTCLMQISTRTEDFVVDTLVLRNQIGPCLGDIFSNPSIRKVMHGADRDIHWLQKDFGIYVCNLFDTGQASRVLQLERNSLEFLLRHYCEVTADKEYQTADWRLRPLPSEMIKYAREDTHYLLYIHDIMKEKLAAMHQESGNSPIFEVFKRSRDICLQLYEKELLTESSFLHIYGLHEEKFSMEQLCVVAALYEWRDNIARVEDESTGYILPNKVLMKIARKIPTTLFDLRMLVSGAHSFVEQNLASVLKVIRDSKGVKMQAVQNAFKAAEKLPVNQTLRGGMERLDNQSLQPPLTDSGVTKTNSLLEVGSSSCNNASKNEVTMQCQKSNLIGNEAIDRQQGQSVILSSNTAMATAASVREIDSLISSKKPSVLVGMAKTSSLFRKNKGSCMKKNVEINTDTMPNELQKKDSQHQISEKLPSDNNAKENEVTLLVDEKRHQSDFSSSSIGIDTCNSWLAPKLDNQDATVVTRVTGAIEVKPKVTFTQVQRKPRGLASMLGSSKAKNRTSSMASESQDKIESKVEQIKASLVLPFQANQSQQMISLCKSPTAVDASSVVLKTDSKEEGNNDLDIGTESPKMVSEQDTQSEEFIAVDNGDECLSRSRSKAKKKNKLDINKESPNTAAHQELQSEDRESPDTVSHQEIQSNESDSVIKKNESPSDVNNVKVLHIWPPVPPAAPVVAYNGDFTNGGALPPSLSELRRNFERLDQKPYSSDHHRRKKRPHSPESQNLNGLAMPNTNETPFMPFDYAAARQSIGFSLENNFANSAQSSQRCKNKQNKKERVSSYDPMKRISAESTEGAIQPGKRAQVFPASGNRSATFRN